MKKIAAICYSLFLGLSALGGLSTAHAEDAPATPPAATTEQRIADIEAYLNNGTKGTETGADGKATTWTTNLGVGPGHNAWMMTSTALVLFMTLPGLALFYGGMVRKKNVLSVLAQMMGITGVVTVLWWAFGYSLAFSANADASVNTFIGSFDHFFFKGIDSNPSTLQWVPENVFAIFQLTFAIITPALIFGAVAERMKFSAVLAFVILWMFVVYFPMAHMVWGGGLMAGTAGKIHAIDFAGGTVVHMTSGWSALILALILGPRIGYGKVPIAPHSLVLTMIGTSILWVGWYGFNAGSAGAADIIAANAFTTTTLATAIAGLTWAVAEWIFKGKPSVLGFCSGIVAGLVVITPACGFVNSTGGVIIGIAAGLVPFFMVAYVKKWIGYDDALDTFGVHGIGGALGAILTGVLADEKVNGAVTAVKDGLVIEQLKAVGVTILISVIGTAIIAFIVKLVLGLRPTPEQEEQGLDISDHGEEGYIL